LTQYLLAVDRNNPRVADLYQAFHPAVLSALKIIAETAREVGKPVSVCGELAGNPLGSVLLMAMGYDVLSMNATNLPKIKSAIRGVTKIEADELLQQVMGMDDADEIHHLLRRRLRELGLSQLTRPVIPD
jgi:phosphotransferase system enzyme I (PtsP)